MTIEISKLHIKLMTNEPDNDGDLPVQRRFSGCDVNNNNVNREAEASHYTGFWFVHAISPIIIKASTILHS